MKSGSERKYSFVVLKKNVKRSSDKFVLDEFITVFFAARIGQKKNQMSEDLRHILCAFIGWEICFKMEIYQLASCYWRFSRTDVKFK